MFKEAGVALSRHPSQDNGLDGPFSSGTSKVEQVLCVCACVCLFECELTKAVLWSESYTGH